jgi:hypothetical protein
MVNRKTGTAINSSSQLKSGNIRILNISEKNLLDGAVSDQRAPSEDQILASILPGS